VPGADRHVTMRALSGVLSVRSMELFRSLPVSWDSPAATPQDPVHASSTAPDIRPLRAAHACTHAKTPSSAFSLMAGSLGTSCEVPPAGFEPAHTAPEAPPAGSLPTRRTCAVVETVGDVPFAQRRWQIDEFGTSICMGVQRPLALRRALAVSKTDMPEMSEA
jgi:hypothetical protein